jgi:hypothetical protein
MENRDFITDYKDRIIKAKGYVKIDLKDFEYNYNSIIDNSNIRYHHEGELNILKFKDPFKTFVSFLYLFSFLCFNFLFIKKRNNNLILFFSKYDINNTIDAEKLRKSPILVFYDLDFRCFLENSQPHSYKMLINNNKVDDDTYTYQYVIGVYRLIYDSKKGKK